MTTLRRTLALSPRFITARFFRQAFTLLLLACGPFAATPGQAAAAAAGRVNFQSAGTVAHLFDSVAAAGPAGSLVTNIDTGDGAFVTDTFDLSPAPTLTATFATNKVLVFTLTAPAGKQIRVTPVGANSTLNFQLYSHSSSPPPNFLGTLGLPVWENGQGDLPASIFGSVYYSTTASSLSSFMQIAVTGSFAFTKLTVTLTLPAEAVASFANHSFALVEASFYEDVPTTIDPGPRVTFETLAAPTIVTNTNDSGVGSLRQAVLNANANAGADAITFDPTVFASAQTIVLVSGLPAFTENTTVTGPAAGVTVQGASGATSFQIGATADVSLTGLTFTNGDMSVRNHGTARVSACEFSASTNLGILNENTGTLVVNDSAIRGVYSLVNRGTATMTGCTVITGGGEVALITG